MTSRTLWPRILTVSGGIAMLGGAIDPLEGAPSILLGSGLVALGTYCGGAGRRLLAFRIGVFVLVTAGVAALWGLSMAGGFGGASGRSSWWGLLILPYLIGWSIGIWGPGSPRWQVWLGMAAGLYYLVLSGVLSRSGVAWKRFPSDPGAALVWLGSPAGVLALVGLATLAGCLYRLRKGPSPIPGRGPR